MECASIAIFCKKRFIIASVESQSRFCCKGKYYIPESLPNIRFVRFARKVSLKGPELKKNSDLCKNSPKISVKAKR